MQVGTIGIIGAGAIGSGIAEVCAVAGLDVILTDLDRSTVNKGAADAAGNLDRHFVTNKHSAAGKEAARARIKSSTSLDALAPADIVIEAVIESFEVKRTLLKRIDPLIRSDAIIACNSCLVSITKLAAAISHPDRVIGLHFFNPVPATVLVEIVRGLQTSDTTHDAVEALAIKLGKTPITVRNSPGLIVNRLLLPMLNEAFSLLAEDEAGAAEIDLAMKLGCNHPIGPLALADLIGLDVLLSVLQAIYDESGDPKYRPAPLLKELVDAGYLGRKTGRGVFRH